MSNKNYLKIAGNIHLSYYVEAADILGISYEMMVPYLMARFWNDRKVWFVLNTVNPLTNSPSATIAKRKNLTNLVLEKAGIPVPKQVGLRSPEDAVKFWSKEKNIVIKPLQALGGKGVSILPETEQEVIDAYKDADDNTKAKGKDRILGEKFVEGKHYRLLVLDDKVIGAVERIPASVIADGNSTIRELIEKKNRERKEKLMMPIPIDDQTKKKLALTNLTPDSIPSEGEKVETRLHANMSAGGTTRECVDEIDPSYLDIAVEAVRAIGMKFGGVDLIAVDITKKDAPCAINEINYNPGLRLHYKPSEGKVVKVAIPVMKYIAEN